MAEFSHVIHEYNRMCKALCCPECPLWRGDDSDTCRVWLLDEPQKAEAKILLWAQEHPAQTWENRLREACPEADINEVEQRLCPGDLFKGAPQKGIEKRDFCSFPVDCTNCWAKESKK